MLCETIKDFIAKVARSCAQDDDIPVKCGELNGKLDALLLTLDDESSPEGSTSPEGGGGASSGAGGAGGAAGGLTGAGGGMLADAVANVLSTAHMTALQVGYPEVLASVRYYQAA